MIRPVAFWIVLAVGVCSAQEDFSEYGSTDATAVGEVSSEGMYIVRKWDTLWDLALKYMEDPFRWPDIWDVNSQVANPHLIYPGDRLRIPGFGSGSISATEERAYLEAPDFGSLTQGLSLAQPKVDEDSPQEEVVQSEGRRLREISEIRLLQSLVSKHFFSDDFLARVGYLWFEKDAKGKMFPGNAMVDECGEEAVLRQFESISIKTFAPPAYNEGDIIDIVRSDRFVKFEGKSANLVRSVGRAKVTSVSGKRIKAQLLDVWDVIRCRDRVAPIRAFPGHEIAGIADAPSEISANVIERIEDTETPYLYHTFLIDRGSSHGVQFGDIFAVHSVEQKRTADDATALACAVNVGDNSASLAIVKMHANRIKAGDEARLSKRLEFKD